MKPDFILRPYAGAESPGPPKDKAMNFRDNKVAPAFFDYSPCTAVH